MEAPNLNPCPKCGKRAGELKKSDLPTRFPWRVECSSCGFMTDFVRLPGVAVKLWNEAKVAGKAMSKSKAKRGQ